MDFLKSYPNVTRDEYMWKWSVPQIKLAMYDNTHIEYIKDKNKKRDKKDKQKGETFNISSFDAMKARFGFVKK